MKLVSIVIPYYKKPNFIEKTINSILKQSYYNFEIIIVYDDPEPEDLALINEISKKDKRIIIVKNSRNLGAAKSRNIGISRSRGYYLAFIDADDLWHPNKLTRQLQFMKNNNLSFSYTSYKVINDKGNILKKKSVSTTTSYKNLLTNCDIGLSTVVMKKNLITKTCKFANLKTKEDYALWLLLAKKKSYLFGCNEFLTKWRKLDNSLSSDTIQKLFDGYRVYNKYLKFNFYKSIIYLFLLSVNFIKKNL